MVILRRVDAQLGGGGVKIHVVNKALKMSLSHDFVRDAVFDYRMTMIYTRLTVGRSDNATIQAKLITTYDVLSAASVIQSITRHLTKANFTDARLKVIRNEEKPALYNLRGLAAVLGRKTWKCEAAKYGSDCKMNTAAFTR